MNVRSVPPAEPRTVKLNSADNLIVAVDQIDKGVEVAGVTSLARVPKGHKMAIERISSGQPVVKFGQIIGVAKSDIAPGDWLHEHNVGMAEFERDYAIGSAVRPVDMLPEKERATFEGFRRANGKAGTRNYIGILTSVNCSASVARFMAEAANRSNMLAEFPNVDGVVSFVHGTGSGMASLGEGLD